MTGGFAINGQLVTLTDITCPVLAFIGEVDDIGQPAAVRGIRRAAPNAEVYEYSLRTGHFGLVVGSKAAQESWPTVADWVLWISGSGDKPTDVFPMADQPDEPTERGVALSSRLMHGLGEASEVALTLARGAAGAVVAANKSMRTLAVETVRTLPRLARLGQINDHTRISLGRIINEQADDAPNGEFLLFDGRRAYLRSGEPAHRQRRAWPDRGRGSPGRARRRPDGNPAKRPGGHRRTVAIGRRRRLVEARRRPGRGGPARRSDRDHHRSDQPERRGSCLDRSLSSAAGSPAICICPTMPASSTWSRSTRTRWSFRPGTGPTRGMRGTWRSSRSAPPAGSSSPSRSPTTAGRCRRSAPRPPRRWAATTPCTA